MHISIKGGFMKKRHFLLIFLVILSILCTTVFVACDVPNTTDNNGNSSDSSIGDNGDGSDNAGNTGGNTDNTGNSSGNTGNIGDNTGNTGEIKSTVESELNDGKIGSAILEALYGYTLKSFGQKTEANSETVFSGTNFGVAKQNSYFGEGFKGYFYTYDSVGDSAVIYIHFYDSEDHATKAMQNELTDILGDYSFRTQVGKSVIIGTSAELWDEVKACKLPEDGTFFAYEKMIKLLSKPYSEIFVEDIFNRREQTLKETEECCICTYPAIGNCYEEYLLITADNPESEMETDFINRIGKLYTDDSYIMRKGDYLELYSKMKEGLHFELNGDGESYILSHFFTESNVDKLIIPSTYNGKPVTGISHFFNYLRLCPSIKSITVPVSITSIANILDGSQISDIYYGGTKSEWAEVQYSRYPDSEIPTYTVHCTDGNIEPEQ